MKMMFKKSASICLLLAFSACSDELSTRVVPAPLSVKAAKQFTVQQQDIPVYFSSSGSVTSDHRVVISSRLTGYIRDLKVREGDRVRRGQVLLHIDPVHARQALIQAKADVHHAKVELQRYQALLQQAAVTKQQFDKVKLRYQLATSQLKQAKHQLAYAEVRSPVDGVVVEKRMQKGDLAAVGMPILSLEDPSQLLVETYVSEQFVSKIHVGDAVDVVISSLQKHFKGTVRQVVQAADSVSHQFLVKVSLPLIQDIHPGMYAQTRFTLAMRQALLIPGEAVLKRDGLSAVYVVDAASIVHYRLIRLGQQLADKVEVLSGLHDGDRLVWAAKTALRTGMKVDDE